MPLMDCHARSPEGRFRRRLGDHVFVAVQPAGTVTFVFTDIEGSTELLDNFGAEAFKERW